MQISRPTVFLAWAMAFLAVLVGATAVYSARLPFLGVTMTSSANGDVQIDQLSGASGKIVFPARLLAVSTADGRLSKVALSGNADVVRRIEGDVGPEHLAAQNRLLALAGTGVVRLWLADSGGNQFSVLRPVGQGSLPIRFWMIALTGLFGAVTGAWLFAMRPAEPAAQAAALTGLGLLVAGLPLAVISASEFIIGGTRYEGLIYFNYLGSQVFGAAFVWLFSSFPVRLFSPRSTAIGIAALAFAIVPMLLLAPSLVSRFELMNMLVSVDLALMIAMLVLQWRATKFHPSGRAYLRLVGTVTALSLGCWIALFPLQSMHGGQPLLDFSYGFLLMVPPFAAIVVGIAKGHVLDLDGWAGRLFASAVVLLALVGADFLLVLVVGMNAGSAASAALLLVGTGWLILRGRLFDALTGARRGSQVELAGDAVEVALAPTPEERFDRWQAVLVRLFQPLEIVAAGKAAGQAQLPDNGRSLLVPAPAFGHALLLRGARSGRALFRCEDCATVDSFLLVCGQIDAGREAYDRGTREERERIARDLHDDVSGRLLTSLHRADAGLVRADVRAAIADIRSIVTGLEGHRRQLDEFLGTLRHDCTERLEASGIACDWLVEADPVHLDQPVSYAVYKAVNSTVREAMTNVIRHARADRVNVSVALEDHPGCTRLRLIVTDNGIGIGPNVRIGHGTNNIRTRIEAIGGSVAYSSSKTPGTGIGITVPIKPTLPPEPGMAARPTAPYGMEFNLPDPT